MLRRSRTSSGSAPRSSAASSTTSCCSASSSTPSRFADLQPGAGAIRRSCTTPPIAIVDEDHSPLSRAIAQAFLPPYFKPPEQIDASATSTALMDTAQYTFVLDIPPHFQRDVQAGRSPAIQVNVDATAMMQAGIGAGYAQQISSAEIARFVARRSRAQPRRSTSRFASPSTRTSRPPGSPASWASSTTSPCWRSSWPARPSSASASTARWTIC